MIITPQTMDKRKKKKKSDTLRALCIPSYSLASIRKTNPRLFIHNLTTAQTTPLLPRHIIGGRPPWHPAHLVPYVHTEQEVGDSPPL